MLQRNFQFKVFQKLLQLRLFFSKIGNDLWQRVGYEPSGNSFNSLVQLENENGIQEIRLLMLALWL